MTNPKNYMNVAISISLVKEIRRKQKDLQLQENIKRGRKAKKITFTFASQIISKILRRDK